MHSSIVLKRLHRFAVLLVSIACAMLLTANAYSQGITASIVGTVTDASGATVGGASVTVRETDTNATRVVTSSSAGTFTVTQLAPGTYSVKVDKAGFKVFQRNDIILVIDQVAQMDAKLEVGSDSQTVNVSGDASVIQTEASSIGVVIDSQTLQNTPLNSHLSIVGLLQLIPGVQAISATAQDTLPVRGVTFSIGGAQRNSYGGVGFTLDGVTNTDVALQRGEGEVPPLDAISEFKMVTSGGTAEFGQGAQVIVVSKSGSNQLHGELLEFNRSKGTAAKSYFAGAQPRPAYQRNEYGGNVNGPIYIPKLYDGRNRSFFFFGYEGYRLQQSATISSQQPTLLERQGIFTEVTTPILNPLTGQPFSNNTIPQNMLSTVDLQLQNLLYPLPTKPGIGLNTVELVPFTDNVTRFSLRLDHRIGSKDQIRGTFLKANYGPNADVGTSSKAGGFSQDGEHNTNFIVGWTHIISPSLLVDTYASYFHLPIYRNPQNNKTNWGAVIPTLPYSLGQGAPGISITNIASPGESGGGVQLEQDEQINTAVTKVFPKHTVKAGFSYLYDTNYSAGGSVGSFSFAGRYSGNAYADFLLGYPNSTGESVPNYTVSRNNSSQYGMYIQDDFKLMPRLTLNAGVRYDLQVFQANPYGQNSLYVPSVQKVVVFAKSYPSSVIPAFIPNTVLASSAGLPTNVFSYLGQAKTNIAPRFGFAYQAFPNTVLRGAAGLFYNLIPSQYVEGGAFNGYPFTSSQTFSQPSSSVPAFSMYAPFSSTGAFGANPSVNAQHSTVAPYEEQYNLAVEHQFAKGLDLRVGYVGQHNVHLNNSGGSPSRDINQPPPGPGAVQQRRPVQPFAAITYGFEPMYHTNMNSLQVGVHKRYSNGFMVNAEFQWERMLGLETFENPANIGDSHGPIGNIAPVTFRFSYSYGLPFGKGHLLLGNTTEFVDRIVSGWQLSGITAVQEGTPFSVSYTAPGSPLGLVSGRANVIPGVPLYPASKTKAKWFNTAAFAAPAFYTYGTSGYNMLRGPSYQNWDLNLTKNTTIWREYRVQLRAEAFNAFNHPNFGAPGATITNPSTFGVISSVVSENRTMEFGMKFNF
ncbi:MAG TPA: TonB-dependent receptor [Acidobacteriaceae bacterium]